MTVLHDSHIPQLPAWILRCLDFLNYGHTAVAIFIVISGFCLMLPLVNTSDRKLRGGLINYIKRRATRILPPYYAALIGSLAIIVAVPAMQHSTGTNWDTALPIFTRGMLLSHLFVVHDLNPRWFTGIDPPMWSIAVEWHIYFIFPLLALIWRKFGIVASTLAGVLIGYAIHRYHLSILEYLQPQFVGMFAFGMAACWIGFSPHSMAVTLRKQPILWVTLMLLGSLGYVAVTRHSEMHILQRYPMISDYTLGTAVVGLLVYCSCAVATGSNALLLRVVEAKKIVQSGAFSYSLYLIHFPILSLAYLGFRHFTSDPIINLLLLFLVASPFIILVSYWFYRAFEKPFISVRAK